MDRLREEPPMSIQLHCPKCGKLIKAPDDAGGRHGKCPYCKESVYVPMPADESEEIGLAPIDEEAQRRAEQERRASLDYVASISQGRDARPEDMGDAPGTNTQENVDVGVLPPGGLVDVASEVELFILAMRDSKLDEAEQVAARLVQAGPRAQDYVHNLINNEAIVPVENVPPPVVQGFLRTLLERLG